MSRSPKLNRFFLSLYWILFEDNFFFSLCIAGAFCFLFSKGICPKKYPQILEKIQANGLHYCPRSSLVAAAAAAAAAAASPAGELLFAAVPWV